MLGELGVFVCDQFAKDLLLRRTSRLHCSGDEVGQTDFADGCRKCCMQCMPALPQMHGICGMQFNSETILKQFIKFRLFKASDEVAAVTTSEIQMST